VSDPIRIPNDKVPDQAKEGPAPELVSAARRWILRAGLTAPVILTLRSKPLFADSCGSVYLSATYLSHHRYLPTCTQQTTTQQTQP
jgi:hypothetical protein